MKSINFNDDELEYMIGSYQVELSYAQDEVARIKDILRKIELAKKEKAAKDPTTVTKKRGRKSKSTVLKNVDAVL